MADESRAMEEVIQGLESGLSSSSVAILEAGPDNPTHHEQLLIHVSTGKTKEVISVQLTHEQVRRLDNKDVQKHNKGTNFHGRQDH